MWPLEVCSGLYKCAAILHFSVSTVPAKLLLIDCGGSGRGLPVDARPHIFLDFFHFWVGFTLQDPSGRTFCVDKGRLQHSNYRLHSVFPLFSCRALPECQQDWRRLLCAGRPGMLLLLLLLLPLPQLASQPAAFTADIWDMSATV